ncbi:AAA family ATPase [Methylomagnum ishizawai]|uniref:AAA family ATPase n=1 Tax=Methylomagnum ishizawai TaxID=1760988 RepID=UPI001C328ED0|nr:AAA family ATPase [Methylomagnum ishizawai]BBL73561.1 ATPase [Methylomagnum ishizawai]
MTTLSKSLQALRDIVDSGRPLAYVKTSEEQRIAKLLAEAAKSFFAAPVPLWTWSLTEGMKQADGSRAEAATARAALDFIAEHPGPALFHLKDFHEPMQESADIRRRLRDLYTGCFDQGKFVFITSPVQFLPPELDRDFAYLELGVPDLPELETFLQSETALLQAAGYTIDGDEATQTLILRALQGLTLDEARHALRRALAGSKHLGRDSLPALYQEKRQLVNRSGMIQFISEGDNIGHIGGLEIMKQWLIERRRLFQQREKLGADIVPKGILVMGISGCGKSLSVKAIANCFELPLYRIDMGEIFSGRHGSPESAFARACRMLEGISPAVVWFDEIEMGITSTESAGEQGRIFAFFLTWMQEKTKGLFVAATANRIDLLPAEMIRKGRFDEVFFVDLPLDDERVDIFRIHLERRGIDASGFNLERLKRFTKGWTGAEVEQCVVAALTTARLEERELNEDDLMYATGNIVPLSKTMKEQVDHIRNWARDRALKASPSEFAT